MNFLDLYKKIQQLDEGASQGNMMPQAIGAEPSSPKLSECGGMGECGGDMAMSHEPSKQQDSVNMNVSMNASGPGGIRDLMNILKNIDHISSQSVDEPDHDNVIIDQPSEEPSEVDFDIDDEMETEDDTGVQPVDTSVPTTMPSMPVEEEPEFANMPDPKTMAIAAVSAIGDDLASKGKEAPKQAGGGNPWNVSESTIAAKLAKHYNEVKTRN